MRIFDETKTYELNKETLNFEKGYLKPDKKFVRHHEATLFVKGKTAQQIAQELEAQGVIIEKGYGDMLCRVVKEYEGGGRDTELIEDDPDTPAKEAYDEYEDIQVYVSYTEEELKERADRENSAKLKAELAQIKEDIEQENFGIIRSDYAEKKARAAEIINELRVLEGKEPRKIKTA